MAIPDPGATRTELNGHTITIEPDQTLHVILRGDLRLEETKFIQAQLYALGDRYGGVACLFDISRMAGFDHATRQAWVRVSRPLPVAIGCFYGGSFTIRTLISTVYKAGRLLLPDFFQFTIEFPPTEAEGRALIAAYRAKAAKK